MDIMVMLKAAGAALAGVVLALARFIVAHKDIVAAIVRRVEQDTADGTWTNEEKEQEAIDIYNQQIKPGLPWYMQAFLMLVPESVINNWLKGMIAKICAKSGTIKVSQ